MSISIYVVTNPLGAHCPVCGKRFAKGDVRIDLRFGSGWPRPRVSHSAHYHMRCFMEEFDEALKTLFKYKAGQKIPEANLDGRVDGVLETME